MRGLRRGIFIVALWALNLRGWEGAIIVGVVFGVGQWVLLRWYQDDPVINLVLAMLGYVVAALVVWGLVRLWWRVTGRRVKP